MVWGSHDRNKGGGGGVVGGGGEGAWATLSKFLGGGGGGWGGVLGRMGCHMLESGMDENRYMIQRWKISLPLDRPV